MPEGKVGLTDKDVEEVTSLVQRYCAVETSDGDESPPPPGYFALKQGPSARKATKARAPVAWGEFARTVSEVLRRVRELAQNGEGHVFLAAYGEGDKFPIEQVRIQGSTDEIDATHDDGPVDGGSIAALVHCLYRSNAQILAENREWKERAFRGLDGALEDRERMTALAMHSALMENAGADQRMQQALEALGPTIEAMGPKVVDIIRDYLRGGAAPAGDLPAEPGPRIEAMIARLGGLASELGPLCTANPGEVTRARIAPLFELVRNLAGPLGLTVTGYPAVEGAS